MEQIKLWKVVCEKNEKPKAVPVEMVAETTTEKLLEEALMAAPDLLMPNLDVVGRQVEMPAGALDLLGVDEDGRLVVFELKRGKLRREAVAQAIDYGSYLDSLEPEELCSLINTNHAGGADKPIDDFAQWYQSNFPQHPLAEIGRPRIVLVGLGVDEPARRMVTFLAQSELDISVITFQGFKQGGEILLARQVEVQSQIDGSTIRRKQENQAKLDRLLGTLCIAQNYAALIAAIKQGLGESAYQSPNPNGYSFYLPEGSVNRAYIALYAPEHKNGKIQILLQARAVEAAGKEKVDEAAKAMGSNFVPKPGGLGEIWIDGHEAASKHAESLRALGQAISAGRKAKMENRQKAEASEANNSA